MYVCPGCGRPVEPGEDFVVAREYKLEEDVGLRLRREDRFERARRRFHVGHFRGRMGELFYELVPKQG
jgi:hypothetical protein